MAVARALTGRSQFLTRHGARAPYLSIPGITLATWYCDFSVFQYPQTAPVSPAVDFDGQLYRKTYIPGREALPGNCSQGQLTNVGAEMVRMWRQLAPRHSRCGSCATADAGCAARLAVCCLRSGTRTSCTRAARTVRRACVLLQRSPCDDVARSGSHVRVGGESVAGAVPAGEQQDGRVGFQVWQCEALARGDARVLGCVA